MIPCKETGTGGVDPAPLVDQSRHQKLDCLMILKQARWNAVIKDAKR